GGAVGVLRLLLPPALAVGIAVRGVQVLHEPEPMADRRQRRVHPPGVGPPDSRGAMALTREDREQFLAEPHIGAPSVTAEPGRAPLVVPIWYQYTPGGRLWVLTGGQSRKARLIEDAGRFSL